MSAAKPGSLKVVLDTNVYVSAFTNARGKPFRIWQNAVGQRYRLLISPAILRELADVLRTDLAWPEPGILARLKLIRPADFYRTLGL
jgi:hypothetical protein